ncbi:MAG: 2-phospho-L-lactate guanylyltransferase [Pseudomonadota bacterium]|nr:2-phospho-L-lactate guanylyltransferase [Pseudomonadota bacterium]
MTKSINIIIPLKGYRDGKSRLMDVLSDRKRYELNQFLITHTLTIASTMKSAADITVISPDSEIEAVTLEFGAAFIHQKTNGLNPALCETGRLVPSRRTIYIAGDLPSLNSSDLECLSAVRGIGISPDERDEGTNALSLPEPLTIPFSFGFNSFQRHFTSARKTRFTVDIVRRSGLAFDLDTKEHLSRLKDWSLLEFGRNVTDIKAV